MKGRKAVPTQLKIIRGNPGNRPLNKDEPKYTLTNTAPPAHLQGAAKKRMEPFDCVVETNRRYYRSRFDGAGHVLPELSDVAGSD